MDDATLTGAEALTGTLADHGVAACFANPGTSEMHLVTALDREPRIHSVLCLFEGVATGAADGYARVTGKPAMTLLHLGPGYLNAGANIHNARRAFSPMINVIGDHAVSHQRYDAPLASDIIGLAAPSCRWIKSVDKVEDAGRLAAEAWAASFGPEPGPVALVLPADSAWTTGAARASVRGRAGLRAVAEETVGAVAEALRGAKRPMILINGTALGVEGLRAAARLKAAGVRIMTDTFFPRMARGAGRFVPDRMQYFAEMAVADLAGTDLMVLAGTRPPVAFFAYPGKPSLLVPDGCQVHALCGPDGDSALALLALAEALGARDSAPLAALVRPDAPTGELSAASIGASLARHLPEGALVSDDGVSNGLPSYLATAQAAPHDWMMLTGGAIGQGMPLALGAAIGAPGRKVVCLTGDGAGMYTNQALWSMARERADVTTIVFVNHSYRILNIELYRTGAGNPGPAAKGMLGLGDPPIDWVKLAEAQGVAATYVTTAPAFDGALERAMGTPGPHLIAALVPG